MAELVAFVEIALDCIVTIVVLTCVIFLLEVFIVSS